MWISLRHLECWKSLILRGSGIYIGCDVTTMVSWTGADPVLVGPKFLVLFWAGSSRKGRIDWSWAKRNKWGSSSRLARTKKPLGQRAHDSTACSSLHSCGNEGRCSWNPIHIASLSAFICLLLPCFLWHLLVWGDQKAVKNSKSSLDLLHDSKLSLKHCFLSVYLSIGWSIGLSSACPDAHWLTHSSSSLASFMSLCIS